ncbi:MBL fold metallo-hydrolase [Segetibacter sp. 3557_3]|nr:MBL fold metallo-hydrolase [Segetibacter sp. 3557_3]
MRISFHGAARTVTGTKHLIKLDNGTQILLDCGMFQGMGTQTDELNRNFGFDPRDINYLLLSHAHIDHTGLIPKLVKDGFEGKIFCTPATKDLTEILLHDSAEIQCYDLEYINKRRAANDLPPHEPFYDVEVVGKTMERFETVDYDQWTALEDGMEFMFSNAGHLIGSAAVNMRINENGKTTSITFSADIGRYSSVILSPPAQFPQADHVILETTYGNKQHDALFNTVDTLRSWIKKTCIEKKGKLIIPAFSVGRTQEVLYALNQLELEKRLPELSYFVDSPLSQKATQVVKSYPDNYNEKVQRILKIDEDPFKFNGLKFVETVEDSRKLVDYQEPCVIISASGMADAGRVKHHIMSTIGEEKNTILFVGYCETRSLGGQLLSGEKQVEIFGEVYDVIAEVGQMQSMSAHGDYDDLLKFLSCQEAEKVKNVFLVHGEYDVQKDFAERLQRRGYENVTIPALHSEVVL